MPTTAQLAVQFGPDQGQEFPLLTDLVRIGRDEENEVILTDPDLAEHHASIVQRDGRFAIVTAHPAGLQIDETVVPPERWIWLPDTAAIRLSPQTVLKFSVTGTSASGDHSTGVNGGSPAVNPTQTAAATQAASPASPPKIKPTPRAAPLPGTATPGGTTKGRRSVAAIPPPAGVTTPPTGVANAASVGTNEYSELSSTTDVGGATPPSLQTGSSDRIPRPKKGETKKPKQTARFITDAPGETLVRLGEDGVLPELALEEAATPELSKRQKKETSPLILVGVILFSLTMTGLMLFVEGETQPGNSTTKAAARRELSQYLGDDSDSLAPYQHTLRRAKQAWARGDRRSEQTELRRVLRMLRSESTEKMQRFSGLTGRREYDITDEVKRSDRRLEELIAALLAED